MNNLFAYAPKELSTDAFLKWLFIECVENKAFSPLAAELFSKICLLPGCEPIEKVECLTQHKSVDLFINFNQNNLWRRVLFENKTWTSIHSDQLNRYKKTFPDCDNYIYLKLGYIDFQEIQMATSAGYKIVSASMLLDALRPLHGKSLICDQYICFLKENFIDYINSIRTKMANNSPDIFNEREAQRIFLSEIGESLKEIVPGLYMKSFANNGGTPCSQLDFYQQDRVYGENPEYLFYRIDTRSGRNYLRINQYADIGPEYYEKKMERLKTIREICSSSASRFNIKHGKINNLGMKESEAIIFFFDENDQKELKKAAIETAKEISVKMNELL